MRIGALEAGGTKMVCAVATEQGEILERESFPTTTPDQSIPSLTRWFKERSVDALGIGAFGPTCVDPESPSFGTILETPKLPWRGYALRAAFVDALGVPVGYDTDVNVACLGEATFGDSRGIADLVYVTIGTGVGGGAVHRAALGGQGNRARRPGGGLGARGELPRPDVPQPRAVLLAASHHPGRRRHAPGAALPART